MLSNVRFDGCDEFMRQASVLPEFFSYAIFPSAVMSVKHPERWLIKNNNRP
jgi:hypothetical protein